MKFDLVSDLHIDHWGRNHEFDWLHSQKSDTLIVAGDTSDSVDITCEYLHKLTNYYTNVLVVDGNHEHQNNMENLEESIQYWKSCVSQTLAIYLGDKQPIINGVKFIGICGWWSFDFGLPNIRPEQTILTGKTKYELTDAIIKNQLNQSLLDANNLSGMMVDATLNPLIKGIVVVSHSLPHASCISWNRYPPDYNMVGCYGNSKFQWTLDADINKKCRYWVFGHNHDTKNIPHDYLNFVSNPRGRREDWNRVNYQAQSLEINSSK